MFLAPLRNQVGIEPKFVRGLRVTDAETMEALKDVWWV